MRDLFRKAESVGKTGPIYRDRVGAPIIICLFPVSGRKILRERQFGDGIFRIFLSKNSFCVGIKQREILSVLLGSSRCAGIYPVRRAGCKDSHPFIYDRIPRQLQILRRDIRDNPISGPDFKTRACLMHINQIAIVGKGRLRKVPGRGLPNFCACNRRRNQGEEREKHTLVFHLFPSETPL